MTCIKIINSKSISIFSYYVKIYDKNTVISEGKSINNCYSFCENECKKYKAVIYNKCIYPYKKVFYFIPNELIIVRFDDEAALTFNLIDKNYNLPIKEGKIYLWKMINK